MATKTDQVNLRMDEAGRASLRAWQGLAQLETGRAVTTGEAVAIACGILVDVRGDPDFKRIPDLVRKRVARLTRRR